MTKLSMQKLICALPEYSKASKDNFLAEKYRGVLDSKNTEKTYFTNSERSVTLNLRLFRTFENLGVGGIERAVHHDGQNDRERH